MSTTQPENPVNFSTFIVSVASSALAHLGQIAGSGTPPVPVDLNLARQSLDLLQMLREKTKGNLNEEESHLLDLLQRELSTRMQAS